MKKLWRTFSVDLNLWRGFRQLLMKIALVSPYGFVHPGGVTNHISSLERRFTRMGYEVRVVAPAPRAISTFGGGFKFQSK